MQKFICINVFRDKVHDRYVQKGETVTIDSQGEIERLVAANCIRPVPEGPRQAPPAPPQIGAPQGPVTTPAVETASIEPPERQASTGRRRGRRNRDKG